MTRDHSSRTNQIGAARIYRATWEGPAKSPHVGMLHHPTVAGGVDRGLAFIGRIRAECANNR